MSKENRYVSILTEEQQLDFTNAIDRILHKGLYNTNPKSTESTFYNLYDRKPPRGDIDNWILPDVYEEVCKEQDKIK